MVRWLAGAAPVVLLAAALLVAEDEGMGMRGAAGPRKPDPGCISCHQNLEVMHPWDPLSCTDCHGGNGRSRDKEAAHVHPTRQAPNDERTVPLKYDLRYRRFVNPSDLRVLESVQLEGRVDGRLALGLDAALEWDSRPPGGVVPLDLTLASYIRVTFGL